MGRQRKLSHRALRDRTGERFGMNTVVAFAGYRTSADGGSRTMWRVRCSCGIETLVLVSELKKKTSCRCQLAVSATKHGMSKHPAYWVWRSMHDRCRLPTHQAWCNYGARGIRVCERWAKFDAFWADMGPTYLPGLDLDRVNNDGHYEPANCRWATRRQNNRNKRNNTLIEVNGAWMNSRDAEAATGVARSTLMYRWNRGVRGSDLVAAPNASRRRSTISGTPATTTASQCAARTDARS